MFIDVTSGVFYCTTDYFYIRFSVFFSPSCWIKSIHTGKDIWYVSYMYRCIRRPPWCQWEMEREREWTVSALPPVHTADAACLMICPGFSGGKKAEILLLEPSTLLTGKLYRSFIKWKRICSFGVAAWVFAKSSTQRPMHGSAGHGKHTGETPQSRYILEPQD